MIRKVLALTAVALLAPGLAHALGLGPLETRSALNEPFNARIELVGATAQDFDTLTVELADAAQFQRAGIPLTEVLLNLDIEVIQPPSGADYVSITTREPVREPFLNFLLEINWANGRIIREYTVLLDPPSYVTQRAQRAPAAPPVARAVPSEAEPSRAVQAPSIGSSSYGPTASGDTLWSIASRSVPDPSVSVHQMMLALLEANPDAFINGNINALKQGVVLRIPDYEAATRLSRSEAIAEVGRQTEAWESARLASTGQQPLGTPRRGGADRTSGGESGARLEIVAPGEGEAEGASAAPVAGGSSEINLLRESLDALEQENAEQRARLSEAEEIIDLQQRQIDIKDQELAALQQRLAEQGAAEEAAAPSAEPSPPEAPVAEAEAPAEEPAPEPETAPPPTPRPSVPVTEPAAGGLVDAVPGGWLTVGGAALVVALVVIGFTTRALRGRGEQAMPRVSPALATAGAGAAATTLFDEAETKPRARQAEPAAFSATQPGATAESLAESTLAEMPAEDFMRTMEATAEDLQVAPTAEDPLEEVNVYLAYERFDQAEELVRNAIAKYPNEHKYKLRLLEVFYSANDKRKYEEAARSLRDAVPEKDPLWQSALAMWQEMSPNRALFADSGDYVTTLVGLPGTDAASKTFLDVTGNLAESTQVSLRREAEEDTTEESGLDFDLESGKAGAEEGFVDVTAGTGKEQSVLDLLGTEPRADSGEVLDITAGREESPEAMGTVLDIGAETKSEALEFDLGMMEEAETASDLLDVTKSGEFAPDDQAEILNVTSPGAAVADDEDLLDITTSQFGDTQDGLETRSEASQPIEFDVSDTVAPAFETEEVEDKDEVVPLDSAPLAEAAKGEETLDFDIGSLDQVSPGEELPIEDDFDLSLETTGDLDELEGAATKTEPELGATQEESSALRDTDQGLELTLDDDTQDTLNPEDLSLHGSEIDSLIDDAKATMQELHADDDTDGGFDLSLEDTNELSELAIDETLELPRAEETDISAFDDDQVSLEELTKSMEDTFAGLDSESPELEQSMDLDAELEGAATTEERPEPTIVMPTDPDVEVQSDVDETDTKLNLAKAYIELGDKDGARTILDEVIRDGTEGQRDEARGLRAQLD
jgi:pilus assembly protein FimV